MDAEKLNVDMFVQYAYSGRPLLVKNAAKKWKALDSFSFKFFQDLYEVFGYTPFDIDTKDCQFFRWKSKQKHNFLNLQVIPYLSKSLF